MGKAIIRVEGLAYCEIEIEGASIPPSANLIDSIDIFDGFGIALPTLQLRMFDPSHTLVGEFGFTDATKINVTMSKKDDKPKKRSFRCWGWTRDVSPDGPIVKVTAILDVPKWSAGSYCESFSRQTSSAAIRNMAESSGLTADVDPTSDAMTWLNINTTRNAFSEDVAMRGFSSNGSCMARILTMDNKLRYKDIIKVITGSPKASFLLNVSASEASATPVTAREASHLSGSGVVTHWLNYGWIQHDHNLSGVQAKIDGLDAPLLGSSLPINSDVKGMLKGSRVTYSGFDPGTEPKPASNIHQNYERAMYQNLRLLSLFSERMQVLVESHVDLETMDCCEFKQSDPGGELQVPNKTFSGKYLVGGKCVKIKGGHHYHEIYYLYRPYINEHGNTQTTGKAKAPNKANDGSIAVNPSYIPYIGIINAAASVAKAVVRASSPAVVVAIELLKALLDFDALNPKIPTTPSKPADSSVDADKIKNQNDIRKLLAQLKLGPLSPPDAGITDRTLEKHRSLVKIAADVVVAAMNNMTPESNKVQVLSVERYSEDMTDAMQQPIVSIVSNDSAGKFSKGDIVGDVQTGGFFAGDLAKNNIPLDPNIDPNSVVTEEQQVANIGALFIKEPSGAGLNAANVLVKPAVLTDHLKEEGEKDPIDILKEKGGEEYIKTYGTASPDEAKAMNEEMVKLSDSVLDVFSEDVITDASLTNSENLDKGKDLDFKYGDPALTPVVEKVKSVDDYTQGEESPVFKDRVKKIETVREATEWSDYHRLGNGPVNTVLGIPPSETPIPASSLSPGWESPLAFPESQPAITNNSLPGVAVPISQDTIAAAGDAGKIAEKAKEAEEKKSTMEELKDKYKEYKQTYDEKKETYDEYKAKYDEAKVIYDENKVTYDNAKKDYDEYKKILDNKEAGYTRYLDLFSKLGEDYSKHSETFDKLTEDYGKLSEIVDTEEFNALYDEYKDTLDMGVFDDLYEGFKDIFSADAEAGFDIDFSAFKDAFSEFSDLFDGFSLDTSAFDGMFDGMSVDFSGLKDVFDGLDFSALKESFDGLDFSGLKGMFEGTSMDFSGLKSMFSGLDLDFSSFKEKFDTKAFGNLFKDVISEEDYAKVKKELKIINETLIEASPEYAAIAKTYTDMSKSIDDIEGDNDDIQTKFSNIKNAHDTVADGYPTIKGNIDALSGKVEASRGDFSDPKKAYKEYKGTFRDLFKGYKDNREEYKDTGV